MPPKWENLDREKQDLYLTILWRDGYSEGAIATFFNVGKGVIVRRRQTGLKLPTGGRELKKPPITEERFRDLLDIDEMDDIAARGVTPIAPVSKKRDSVRAPEAPKRPVVAEKQKSTEIVPAIDTTRKAEKEDDGPVGVLNPRRPLYKIASNNETRCVHKDRETGRRCEYEWIDPKRKVCRLHIVRR